MTAGKPVAYRMPDGGWLCPTCWRNASDTPATPYFTSDIDIRVGSPVCLGCGDEDFAKAAPKSPPGPCVFCDIIAGEAPVEWVLRPDFWPDAVAFIPLNPVTEGHCPIAPKRHVQDFAEDPEVFGATARRAAELMRFTPRAMNVLSTRGKAAGQEVMHLHLHLIPREHGDGIRLLARRKK